MIVGQLKRFGKSNQHFSHCSRVQTLTSQLLAQGFRKDKLEERCEQFVREREDEVGKYRKGVEEFVRACFG